MDDYLSKLDLDTDRRGEDAETSAHLYEDSWPAISEKDAMITKGAARLDDTAGKCLPCFELIQEIE